ncbi:MAG: right-handed parallel beta-helix repeat-containing protein [Pseudomonadota bacterium]
MTYSTPLIPLLLGLLLGFLASAGLAQSGSAESSQPAQTNTARILKVGPTRALKLPSAAAKIAKDGDVIEIDAGLYQNDYAIWRADRLTIRGVGDGMVHMRSRGLIPNGKAIWITRGDEIRIDNIEFSGAAVKDTNGAGIRHEGRLLSIHNAFFHHNEFSILSGNDPLAEILITSSRFWFQRRPNRFSHGIYIGAAGRFEIRGSHIKGTDHGHQLKSRARENYIAYNRIEDVPDGNASRAIDLPNCGFSIIIGNDLHQAAGSPNHNFIGYGPEGCESRDKHQRTLIVVNNTVINAAPTAVFVRNFTEVSVTVANNLLLGPGIFLEGKGRELGNIREAVPESAILNWDLSPNSRAVDGAISLPNPYGLSLQPIYEFTPPFGYAERPKDAALDAGSREYVE